jgi:glycosyltransferase involved in cell wall biosynthesis
MKLAFVIQRYGPEIIGGAEYFTKLVAEHLQDHLTIEILTTCAKGYHTWENEYPEKNEQINGILVRRFKNAKLRDMKSQTIIQETVFYQQHNLENERRWIEAQGPYCPELITFIKDHKEDYDYFVFFTYRYYPSYYGIEYVKNKSIIVPFAENDPALDLKMTSELFGKVCGIIYSTPEEKSLIKNHVKFDETGKVWDVIGCGIDIPASDLDIPDIQLGDYILYLGRIEGSKGCYQLFEFYLRLISDWDAAPDLVLAGFDAIGIPNNKKIKFLGFVSEEEKNRLLRNAKMLVMPSPYESFSLVTLESLSCGTPVLVNGECDVLKGHCIRSNSGLWYQNFDEFKACLFLLSTNSKLRKIMKSNGIRYIQNNYSWEVIIDKYLKLFEQIESDLN